jgi:pimeloyl-ACP methyl ester carboxylesterase
MITINSLTFGNHRLVYRTCGSGPDVVLIHGWLSSSRMWEQAMRHLAPHYRVWALDLLGFGESRTTEDDLVLNVDQHVELVTTFLRHFNIQPYAVVGHSMGGAIAIKLALNSHSLMQRLVLVCPVVTGYLHFNIGTLIGNEMTQRLMAAGGRWWPALQTMPGSNLFVAPLYLPNEANRRTLEDFRRATWQATYGGLTSLATIRLDQHLHNIALPTLVITGSQDLTVPPSDSRLAAKLIPNSTFLEYSNCHHQPTDEEPDHFNQTLLDFLKSGLPQAADLGQRADQSA